MALGKLLNLSVPQFHSSKNGIIILTEFIGLYEFPRIFNHDKLPKLGGLSSTKCIGLQFEDWKSKSRGAGGAMLPPKL